MCAATGMIISCDSYAEIAERSRQETNKLLIFLLHLVLSAFLSLSPLHRHALLVPLAVDKPMHPVVNHQKKKKKYTKVTTNNTRNNGTLVTSHPVNNAYNLTICRPQTAKAITYTVPGSRNVLPMFSIQSSRRNFFLILQFPFLIRNAIRVPRVVLRALIAFCAAR